MSPAISTQVNSATGIVGTTGAGKSALLATAAEYLWETFKQVSLLYTADGGGFPTKIQSLQRLGIIRVWRMRLRGEAFETTVRASEGWWPAEIDPASGETEPNVRLVPPVTEQYTMSCPNGHVVKVVPFQSQLTPALCPTCRTHTTKENMQVQKSVKRTTGFEQVGGVLFDGLSSFLSWQMMDMAGRHARQELKGEDTAIGGRINSGGLVLGGNNRSHFGFVQTRAEDMVLKSLSIPGLSIPPTWTMLLAETFDEGGLPVRGPRLVGKAKTDEAPAWFGNMLEVAVVKDEAGHNVRRLYTSEFIDDAGARHLVKHRGGPGIPPFLQDDFGAPWGQVHMGVFFSLLAKEVEDSAAAARGKYADAPGVQAVQYGEGPAAPAPVVSNAAPAAPRATAPSKPRVVTAPTPAPKPAPAAPAAPAPVQEEAPSPAAGPAVALDTAPASPPEVEPPPVAQQQAAPTPAATPAPQAPPSIARPAGIAPPPGVRPAVAPRRPPARPMPPSTAPSPELGS